MTITQAWLFLIALSLGSTVLAWSGVAGGWAALAILALAWIKAQIILRRYLGLAQAPSWSRGFALVLGLYMLGMMGLAAAG
ncbi:Cytochrome C oxidase subunit IV [Thalassovita litoralis]|jgi:hypothetical protein|uniref:Cytochrome C oxidase subunit IV n=1 Tax=Thalassovita litoralis TaxID=1010611 RepID=A0A521ACN1_9RHOB|nr:cytochrome C oxidase subunit IV family protein [Thalassovita litoralis]SMO32569.1 Cytochrome C oxidase subunit IV [Thalassovita litoralis]